MGKSKVTPTSSSCAFAQSSTLCKALTTTAVSNFNSWIIDLGASDHMTKESNFFLSHRPCSGKQKVQVADKTLTRVSGKGNVSLSLKSTLTYVLHVPKMFYNLLSINKLKKTCNCFSNFFPKLLCFSGPHFGEDDWQ